MMHRKAIEPALARLNGERAGYFSALADRIERDPRIEAAPNLVFLVLKETIPYLPTYVTEDELAAKLFQFVSANQRRLNRIIHDRRYVENPQLLAEVTKEFVLQVLSTALEKQEFNEIQEARIRAAKSYRFSWPDLEPDRDFPYREDDA